MTQKAKPASKAKAPKKAAAKPAKPKSSAAYIVVRELPSDTPTHTTPERVFATKAAAHKFADECNRELRALTNPFDGNDPDMSVKGGEKGFIALLKKHGISVPTKQKGYSYIDWEAWWDRAYFDTTDEQRDAIWDALDEFEWYKVKQTTLED